MGKITLDGKATKFKLALDLRKLSKTDRRLFDTLPTSQKAEYVGLGSRTKLWWVSKDPAIFPLFSEA